MKLTISLPKVGRGGEITLPKISGGGVKMPKISAGSKGVRLPKITIFHISSGPKTGLKSLL